jgi:hypothetical protein
MITGWLICSNKSTVKDMQKKLLIVLAFVVVLGACLYAEYRYYAPKSSVIAPEYTFTYLTSAAETTAYCDGENMDSAGYQASLTVKNTGTIAKSNPSTEEKIRATIDASTTGMCHTAMSQATFTEKDGVVTISPIDAWAGASIVMCSCKPQVEANILQVPGIKQVIWSETL